MKRGFGVVLLTLALSGCGPGAAPTPTTVIPTPTMTPTLPTPTVEPTATPAPTATATPPRTETSLLVQSAQVGDRFKIFISLPGGYDPNARPGYHVVYLLDGNWHFEGTDPWIAKGQAVKTMTAVAAQGAMPPAIVVGIGYVGGEEANERDRDFHVAPDKFYAFLKSELVPQIDRDYRTVASPAGRTLIGHSHGGYFALYELLNYGPPDHLFHNVLAISGDYTMYERKLFVAEQRLADRLGAHGLFDAALYLAIGSNDQNWAIRSNQEMKERLQGRGYQQLRLEYTQYSSMDHYSVLQPAIKNGLRWLFKE